MRRILLAHGVEQFVVPAHGLEEDVQKGTVEGEVRTEQLFPSFVNARRAGSEVEDEVIELKHWLEDTQRLLHENVVEEDPLPSGVGQSDSIHGRQQIAASNTEPCGCSPSVLPGSTRRGIVTLGQIDQLG